MRKLLSSVALLLAITSFAQDTLSKQDIQSAARIQDLSFTPIEIDSMYDGVKDNWLIYQLQHKQSLNNSVPMSLWQNPVLPNMRLNQKQAEIKWNYIPNIQLPKDLNDLAYYNLLQLSSLLPKVGRKPVAPQVEDGETIDPQVSVPMAKGMSPATVADVEPADEPEEPNWVFHGFLVLPPYQ